MPLCQVTGRRLFLVAVALGIQLAFLLLFQSKEMVLDELAQGRDLPTQQNPGQLFLYVSGWMEGMSSWMISLSEMLVLAKELNATFVEPCITKGNLCNCANRGSNPLRLSHILDLEKLKDYHPAIVSYEAFQQQTEIDREDDATSIPQVDQAIQSSQHTRTVLEIKRYGRYAFSKSEWVSDEEAERVKRTYLRLAAPNVHQVETLLDKMGISSNQSYSVIHWRAEIPNIDYMACARRIIQARNVMKLDHKVILMSSLNTNASYSWAGAKTLAANTTADKALQLLFDAGFLKLDQVVNYKNLPDSIMFAVYDLILAMKADEFITCGKGCSDKSLCAACNWKGQFAGLAMSLRSEVEHRSSVECWPGK